MSNLTIADLFTPAPSGVDPTNQAAAPASGTWLDTVLAAGARIGLSTTSWQPGDPTRTLLAILSVIDAQQDGLVSTFTQGGFLDWAATGSVTYETAPGVLVTQYVTPDPSILSQNPTGAPGWLDVLAYEVYNVEREQATYAAGQLYILNESGSTYNYAAGSFHVANTLTSASPPPTYSNTAAITLTPSASASVTAISIVGTLVTLTVPTVGLSVGQLCFVDGTGNATLDGQWVTLASVGASSVQFTLVSASGVGTTGTLYSPAAFDFQADVIGPVSNAVSGAVTTLVTTQIGVEVYNPSSWIGANWESNTALVARARESLAALSPSGPAGAYVYFAKTAFQLLANNPILVPAAGGGKTPVTLTNGPITRALLTLDQYTGIVTLTIANAGGTTDGSTSNRVTAATATSPIAITTQSPHGMVTGDFAYVSGLEGLAGAAGYWQIVKTGASTFTATGSTGTGSYTTGGTVECGDLGMVDLIVADNALPDNETEITQWAGTASVVVAGTVYVPVAQVQNYTAALQAAIAVYFATVPIGGVTNVEANNIIPIDAIIGLLYAAGISGQGQASYVQSVTAVTLNGSPADLALTPTNIPVLSGGISSINIVGL